MPTPSESDVLRAMESALEMKPGSLSKEAQAADIEAWDSLGQVSILSALDVLYDGKVASLSEMAKATSVPMIMEILRKHSLL